MGFMVGKAAVFLDRDGTLIAEDPYLSDPSRVRLLPGVGESLATLRKAGILLLVVSNQSGIARGLLDEGHLVAIQQRIQDLLAPYFAQVDAWYHCPHHNHVGTPPERRRCQCRKPLPGLLHRAAEDFDIDFTRSVGVGDDVRDLQAFAALDLRTVLVGTGKGARSRQRFAELGQEPDLACAHLGEATSWILRQCTEKATSC